MGVIDYNGDRDGLRPAGMPSAPSASPRESPRNERRPGLDPAVLKQDWGDRLKDLEPVVSVVGALSGRTAHSLQSAAAAIIPMVWCASSKPMV